MPRAAAVPHDFPDPHHDHAVCGAAAMAEADHVCRKRNARLTAFRRRVLEAIWADHAPIGAYDILARLNAHGERNAPMAVYRALEFLMENGLVHRLSSLNAYIGCRHAGRAHTGQFLICTRCNSVAELTSDAVHNSVERAAK
ncbi:MAG: Fur family transcriptional regulator [Rhodospirillaceae bacterium]|nr:Fur family transcriptional regulator [Rhodospirillaceae bacterium]